MKGAGCDVVRISRFDGMREKRGLLERIFSDREIALFEKRGFKSETLAGRFAAKEAFAKSCGTGFSAFSPREVSVECEESGAPKIVLSGKAADFFKSAGGKKIFVSISHDSEVAMAVAFVE